MQMTTRYCSSNVTPSTLSEIDARAIHCNTCRQISQQMHEKFKLSDISDEEGPVVCIRSGSKVSFIRHVRDQIRDVHYVTMCFESPIGGSGLAVDLHWINPAWIQQWLTDCDRHHGSHCRTLPTAPLDWGLQNLLLLDVTQECLVLLPSSTKYFALSYVWGNLQNDSETTTANLINFKTPGAFRLDNEDLKLPDTIKDAIRLLCRLGERYLWVDRFSIVQDATDDKNLHISRMDFIYANAYCTIVTADGDDASYGIRGVGLGSRPRLLKQQFLELPKLRLLSVDSYNKYRWRHSKYNSWGWTFQELCLSPRILLFGGDTVQWMCLASRCKEDVLREFIIDPKSEPRGVYSLALDASPSTLRWRDLVNGYNNRDLTHASDGYAAFAGIERTLGLSFPGGSVYGLLKFFLDAALLWQASGVAQQRKAIDVRSGQYWLPSWSWLGWKASLNPPSLIPANGYYYDTSVERRGYVKQIRWEVQPLVEWFQINPATGEQRKIRNYYHYWRELGKRSDPPEGWNRHETDDGVYFTNNRAPHSRLRYPIPSVTELPSRTDLWPPHLHFHSSRAFFQIKAAVLWLNFASEPYLNTMSVTIVDSRGHIGGIVRLNLPYGDQAPVGLMCELVAISKGQASINSLNIELPNRVEELYLDEFPKKDGVYEFYNVLMVKWEGAHIIREAIGRVEKSVWEQQELEEMDFELR